jgi:hypothetical protein
VLVDKSVLLILSMFGILKFLPTRAIPQNTSVIKLHRIKVISKVSLLIVGSDMQQFIEETIVKNGLGIHDAHEKEIDKLMSLKSNALLADYTLADMVSRRARIGVDLLFLRC